MSHVWIVLLLVATCVSYSGVQAALQDPTPVTLSVGSTTTANVDAIVGTDDFLFAVVAFSSTNVKLAVKLLQLDPTALSVVNQVSLTPSTFPITLITDPSGAHVVAIAQTDYAYDNEIYVFNASTLELSCQTTLSSFPIEIPPFFVTADYLLFGIPAPGQGFPVMAIGDCTFLAYQPAFSNNAYNYWTYVYGISNPSGIPNVFYAFLNDFYTEPYIAQVEFNLTYLTVTQSYPAYVDTSTPSSYAYNDAIFVVYVNASSILVEIDMTARTSTTYHLSLPADATSTPFSFASGGYVYTVTYGGQVQNGTLSQFDPTNGYSLEATAAVPYNDELLSEQSLFAVAGDYLFYVTDALKLSLQRYTVS